MRVQLVSDGKAVNVRGPARKVRGGWRTRPAAEGKSPPADAAGAARKKGIRGSRGDAGSAEAIRESRRGETGEQESGGKETGADHSAEAGEMVTRGRGKRSIVDELTTPPPFRQTAGWALDCLRPPKRTPPLEWLPKNVQYPAESSANPRPYDLFLFPFHAGVWQAFADPYINKIVLRWGTQLGKTAILTAMVAWIAACDPSPIIWGGPDEGLIRRVMGEKLIPLLEHSDGTRDLLPAEHLRGKETEIRMRYCMLYAAWSGSKSQLGDISARYALCNEVDKWDKRKSTEGDSLALIQERCKAFGRRAKIIIESTPSEAGLSRIDAAIEASDDRRYWIPHPCGHWAPLEFENLELPHDADTGRIASPERCRIGARYLCPKCKAPFLDHLKLPAMQRGLWAPAGCEVIDGELVSLTGRPPEPCEAAGFSLSSLYSTTLTFGDFGAKWSEAQGDVGKLRNVLNGWLGRSYAPATRASRAEDVLRHRGIEDGLGYDRDTCPEMPIECYLVVDVQADCLWYSVWAIAPGLKRYLIRYGNLQPRLDAALPIADMHFPAAGGKFHITHCLMDSGYGERTTEVYLFCRRYGWTPWKGIERSDSGTGAGPASPARWSQVANEQAGKVELMLIDNLTFKDQLAKMITDGSVHGRGSWMLHQQTGLDFARQFTAEVRRQVVDGTGRKKVRWVKISEDNHFWDLAVAAEATLFARQMEGMTFDEEVEQ